MSSPLSAASRAALKDLAEIVLPRGGSLQLGANDVDVVGRIESYLGLMPHRLRKRVSMLVGVFDISPALAFGFLKPFHRLDSSKQEAWVGRLRRSSALPVKLPLVYLEQLILMSYASAPEIEQAIGYDYSCRRDAEPHGRVESA